jgi:hypothetical protein
MVPLMSLPKVQMTALPMPTGLLLLRPTTD